MLRINQSANKLLFNETVTDNVVLTNSDNLPYHRFSYFLPIRNTVPKKISIPTTFG